MSIGIARVAATALFSCCCLMVALPATAAAARSGGSSGPLYNAIFNFGDSGSDAGNLCVDGRPGPASLLGIFTRLPYGVTYFGKPTCRCSDGRVNIDFLARAFGLPFPLPSKAPRKDFQRGANMAIIGGTVLDYSNASLKFTAYDGSMNTQIDNFQQLLPSICGTQQSCKMYLAKSLFVFQLGENDYSIQLVNGSTVDEASKNIPRTVNTIISGVEKLMTLGAVDIVVSNIALMGCFPFYLSMFESSNKSDYDKYGCLRNHNALFKRHNSFLQSSLPKLQKKHPHARIMYADLASHIYQIVQDPRKFGFETAFMSCCGKAGAPHRFDLFTLCGMDGSSVCHDPASHLLWDGMHLSDTANRRIAEGWLSGPYCHPPILQ
ncbi:GDSL esterase/lipase At5g45910-like [Triticum urartu]|nr:GDSL esterase/lipase At5g45910-like [Triticum urartu]